MLAPWWCVNEGTTGYVFGWVFAFANEKSATNDQLLSLTKSDSEISEKKTLLEIKSTSSIVNQLAVNCYKMRALVNNTQNLNILCQHTIIQRTALDVIKIFKSEIFEKFTKNSMELRHTKLTLEIMNKLKLTLEMQPARDPSNCIKAVVEYKLPLAGTGPNHNI